MEGAKRHTGSRGGGRNKPKKTQHWVPKGESQSAEVVPSPETAGERVQPTSSASWSSSDPVTSGGSNSRERRRGQLSPDSLAPLGSDTQDQVTSAASHFKKTRRKGAKRNSPDITSTAPTTGLELTNPPLTLSQAGNAPSLVLVHPDTSQSRKRKNNKKNASHDDPARQQAGSQPPPETQEFQSDTAAKIKTNTKDATSESWLSGSSSSLVPTDSRGLAQVVSTPESQSQADSQGQSSSVSQPKKRYRKKKVPQDTITTPAPSPSLTSPASAPLQLADKSSLGQADGQGQGLLAASQPMKRMDKRMTAHDRTATSPLVGAKPRRQESGDPPSPGSTSGSHMAGGSRLHPVVSGSRKHPISTTSQLKKRKRDKKIVTVPCTPISVHIPKTTIPVETSSEVMDSMKSQVLHFLDKCKCSSATSEFYKSQIDHRTLVIDFNHLLCEDRELSFSICNGDRKWSDIWLTSAADDFFRNNGLVAESTKVHVMNMPDSIANAKDMLNSHTLARQQKLFRGKEEALPLTLHGRTLFDVIQCGLLDRLLKGHTFLGQLTIEDYVFVEELGRLRAIITKPAAKEGDASPEEKALDLNGLWPMMEPFYVKDGVFPLYFKELKEDLTTATGDEVGQSWFLEYLRFHPAIMSSMVRRNFVSNAYHVARKYHIRQSLGFKMIFSKKPMRKDWRKIARGNGVFLCTYNYKPFPSPQKKAKASQKVKGEEMKVEAEKARDIEEGEGAKGMESAAELKSENDMGLAWEGTTGDTEVEGGVADWKSNEAVGTAKEIGLQEEYELELEEEIDMEVDDDDDDDDDDDEDDGNDDDSDDDDDGGDDDNIGDDTYQNSTGSLLDFERHSLQHGDEKIRMRDLAELEFFSAKSFNEFLPFFIKRLLRAGKMGVGCKFEAVWSVYKASKCDQKDLPLGSRSRCRLASVSGEHKLLKQKTIHKHGIKNPADEGRNHHDDNSEHLFEETSNSGSSSQRSRK